MQQGKHNKDEHTEYGRVNTNIWGWRWSWISLVIIVIGFIFLIFIGPKEQVGEQIEEEGMQTEQSEVQDGTDSEGKGNNE